MDDENTVSETYYIVTSVDKENNEGIPEPISVEAVGSISGRVFVMGTSSCASIYVENWVKHMKPIQVFSINYLTAGSYTLIARGPGQSQNCHDLGEESTRLDDLSRKDTTHERPRFICRSFFVLWSDRTSVD